MYFVAKPQSQDTEDQMHLTTEMPFIEGGHGKGAVKHMCLSSRGHPLTPLCLTNTLILSVKGVSHKDQSQDLVAGAGSQSKQGQMSS